MTRISTIAELYGQHSYSPSSGPETSDMFLADVGVLAGLTNKWFDVFNRVGQHDLGNLEEGIAESNCHRQTVNS